MLRVDSARIPRTRNKIGTAGAEHLVQALEKSSTITNIALDRWAADVRDCVPRNMHAGFPHAKS